MILRQKPLKPISDRQKAREAALRRTRPILLERAGGRCELGGCDLRSRATHDHHAFGRSFLGRRWSDDPDVRIVTCPAHHECCTNPTTPEDFAQRDLARRQAIGRLAKRAGVEARIKDVDLRAEALRLTELIEAQLLATR